MKQKWGKKEDKELGWWALFVVLGIMIIMFILKMRGSLIMLALEHVISFLLGGNIGIVLSKYYHKEGTLFDLLYSIILLGLWMIYVLEVR